MNKRIAVLSVLMMAMFLMSVGVAESEPAAQFTFMDTITWDSTPEDVELVLGDDVQRGEETDESIGTVAVLWTENESFAGYECGRMMFTYYNDKLCFIACYYTETDVGDVALLIDGLTQIYGAPHMYESDETTLDDLISGTKQMCGWDIWDDTEIGVVHLKSDGTHSIFPQQKMDSPYLCVASFVNIPVFNQLQEAVGA